MAMYVTYIVTLYLGTLLSVKHRTLIKYTLIGILNLWIVIKETGTNKTIVVRNIHIATIIISYYRR